MIVCLCKGVNDHSIRDAVARGCASVSDLRRELGVASQCAKCARCAREVLDDALTEMRAAELQAAPGMFCPQPA
ncbi:MAG: bacterioferritin-associated ferredoxin [Alcanivoracaceae bacterium]|jgi:bacterioferritin-associated ferredoxin|nr:bacterioferritin-associated ferredoxin [Alcanivoracaceae bacterium]